MKKRMTHDEKHNFIEELKWDPLFRDELFNVLFDHGDLSVISEVVHNKYRYSIMDDISERFADGMREDIKEMIRDEKYEAVKDLKETILQKLLAEKEEIKKDIIQEVVMELARELLSVAEKEIIKNKVQKEMMKLRSYRSDLLDFDDE